MYVPRAAAVCLVAVAATTAGSSCSSSSNGTAAPTNQSTTASASTVTDAARFARFTPCPAPTPFDQPWLCTTLDVPLDRADASAGTISLAVYARVHTDTSTPAAEPVFLTPGGPGYPGFAQIGLYALEAKLIGHHDFITIDPRGTGHSGVIDCPDLQRSTDGPGVAKALIGACGRQLGDASDRYGAADRAMDLEDVRAMLGYDTLDEYGGSYGSFDVQAYTSRFAQHVRAIIVDAGFSPSAGGADYGDFFGVGTPKAFIDEVALQCSRDSSCHQDDPDPATSLARLLQQVRSQPITASSAPGSAAGPVVDEAAVVSLILGADPLQLVTAADAALTGDAHPLVDMLSAAPEPPPTPADYSAGDNAAGNCNDYDTPWDRSDPVDVRRQKLAAAEQALPDNAFAPVSKEAWFANIPPDFCIDWPAPKRFEPVLAAGTTTIDVPALIFSGDVDRTIPTFMTERLVKVFTKSTFVVVAGADHISVRQGLPCASDIAARFLETLDAGDTSCAATVP